MTTVNNHTTHTGCYPVLPRRSNFLVRVIKAAFESLFMLSSFFAFVATAIVAVETKSVLQGSATGIVISLTSSIVARIFYRIFGTN